MQGHEGCCVQGSDDRQTGQHEDEKGKEDGRHEELSHAAQQRSEINEDLKIQSTTCNQRAAVTTASNEIGPDAELLQIVSRATLTGGSKIAMQPRLSQRLLKGYEESFSNLESRILPAVVEVAQPAHHARRRHERRQILGRCSGRTDVVERQIRQ